MDALIAVIIGIVWLGPSIVCFLKRRIYRGSWGVLLPGLGLFFSVPGAFQIAKPGSLWARWFYSDEQIKVAREIYPFSAAGDWILRSKVDSASLAKRKASKEKQRKQSMRLNEEARSRNLQHKSQVRDRFKAASRRRRGSDG